MYTWDGITMVQLDPAGLENGPPNIRILGIHQDMKPEPVVEVSLPNDEIPKVFICATLWHETLVEMTQLLKSICMLDLQFLVQTNLRELIGAQKSCPNILPLEIMTIKREANFDFEVHIMFDDAIARTLPTEKSFASDSPCTSEESFTVTLQSEESSSNRSSIVGEESPLWEYKVNSYVKLFLGALHSAFAEIYQAPGRFNASQFSYGPPTKSITPYGGRMTWSLPGKTKLVVHLKNLSLIRNKKRWSQVMYFHYTLGFLSHGQQKRRLDDTFVFSVDGDAYFEPKALIELVRSIRKSKNPQSAAVCGRLIPKGQGPMAWYQRYEYCFLHWLEKTAECIIGCVLCCPGTSTLYRGSAIHGEILERYGQVAHRPGQVIQRDLGEDRWLSLMLIQRGQKIDYKQDVTVHTYMPESFAEFFNQRRRWIASTLANTAEFLAESRNIRRANPRVHWLFVLYQLLALISLLTGPSCILVMFIWISVIYLHLSILVAVAINLAPLIIFLALCYTTKPKRQLMFAKTIASLYVVVMVIILTRTIYLFSRKGGTSFKDPFTLIFLAISCMTILTAILHPSQLKFIVYWPIYSLYIPTMGLLLPTYTICNLHLPTWGTREIVKKKLPKQPYKIQNFLKCFKRRQPSVGDGKIITLVQSPGNIIQKVLPILESDSENKYQKISLASTIELIEPNAEPDWIKMNWMKDESTPQLMAMPVQPLQSEELKFWQKLILEKLSPHVYGRAQEIEIARGLARFKNFAVVGFVTINMLVIAIMITLKVYKTALQVYWDRYGGLVAKHINFEPLVLTMLLYTSLFIVQFTAMFYNQIAVGVRTVVKVTKKILKSENLPISNKRHLTFFRNS